MIGMGCKDTNRESLCGLLVPKTKTHGCIILLSEKVLFQISVRGVHVQNDGVTLIDAVEKTVQGKGTVDNQIFQTQLIPYTSPVDDHVSNRVAETVLAKEPSAQEGKHRPTWELTTGWNDRR